MIAFYRISGVLLLLGLCGCTIPGTGGPGPARDTVTLQFSSPARTIAADVAGLIQSYDVTLTNTDGQGFAPITQTGITQSSVTIAGVGAGLWTVFAEARDAASNVVAVKTLANQPLPAAAVAVVLAPTQSGTGGLSYTVQFPTSAAVDQLSVQLFYRNVAGQAAGSLSSVQPTLTSTNDGTVTTTLVAASGLPSGTYRLVLSFLRSGVTVLVDSEAVNVWDNVVSNRWLDGAGTLQAQRTFAASEFASSNAQLADLQADLDGLPLTLGAGFSPLVTAYTTTVQSKTATQSLTLTPVAAQPGQYLEYSSDGQVTWTPAPPGSVFALTLTNLAPSQAAFRVTAADGATRAVYTLSVTKLVRVASLTLDSLSLHIPTGTSATLTPLFTPVQTDNQQVTFTVSPPASGLVSLSPPASGAAWTVHALLPGTVTITATSVDDPTVSASASVVLDPTKFTLRALKSQIWGDLSGTPTNAPLGSWLIAGNETTLVALDTAGLVWQFDGAGWAQIPLVVPPGTRRLALEGDGTPVVATATLVYRFQDGFWVPIPVQPSVSIQGLYADQSLHIWGSDGSLYAFEGGLWRSEGFASPPGTTAIVGGDGQLLAFTPSGVYGRALGFWRPVGVSPEPQTVSSTYAYHVLVSLLQR